MKTKYHLSHLTLNNKYLFIFCYFFLSVIIIACKEGPFKKDEIALSFFLKNYKKSTSIDQKVYLFTGLDGCGACLDHTVKFIESQKFNKEVCFIISVKSNVKLKNTFSHDAISSPNFILDTSLLAFNKGLVTYENPIIYLCDKGSILYKSNISFMNADSIFSNINNIIMAKKKGM